MFQGILTLNYSQILIIFIGPWEDAIDILSLTVVVLSCLGYNLFPSSALLHRRTESMCDTKNFSSVPVLECATQTLWQLAAW